MILDTDFVSMMARYNAWQNTSLVEAADTLGETDRTKDRGAFFGSIFGTFSHLMWGDLTWMARFDGGPQPDGGIKDSAALFVEWNEFKTLRKDLDQRILVWSEQIAKEDLQGNLSWYSGALQKNVEKPMGMLVTHFFNHQTHHRGQIHAMLTSAGVAPDDTDLFAMQ